MVQRSVRWIPDIADLDEVPFELGAREFGVEGPSLNSFRGLSCFLINVLDSGFELADRVGAVVEIAASFVIPTDAMAVGRLLYCREPDVWKGNRPSEVQRRLAAMAERRERAEAGWKSAPVVAEFDFGSEWVIARALPLGYDEFLHALRAGRLGREFVLWTPEPEISEDYVRDLYRAAVEDGAPRHNFGRFVIARCGRGEVIWTVELLQGEVEMQCGVYGPRELLEPMAARAGFMPGRGGARELDKPS